VPPPTDIGLGPRDATTVARVPRSPEPARREILDAALRIFATNRISAVSMREIRLAAKQRNGGALQYHFGDMDGLLRALIERELPLLTDRRKALLAVADLAGPEDLWSVAAVWALPYAQLATGSERERYVVRFLSQLHDDTSLPLEKIAGLVADPTTDEAFRLLRERVPEELSDEILSERVQIATNSFVHAASIRASGRASNVSDEEFRTVLVDMFLGALTVVTTKRVET
jgi:AcrR family transcriptional regulator